MFFSIDPRNGLAIYEQIVRQVKFAVAHETLRPGGLVPSVRELARELAINPNTVARAYRELQTEGILDSLRGTGLAVTSTARRRCQEDRVKLVRTRLRQVLAEAKHSQLATEELKAMIEEELARLEK
ncbi:MAG: GntR family transcriptional regulator [Planctomycetes bacterium]|nr:GntR family transcriptional regulator [Planctomycetota bacterium]